MDVIMFPFDRPGDISPFLNSFVTKKMFLLNSSNIDDLVLEKPIIYSLKRT